MIKIDVTYDDICKGTQKSITENPITLAIQRVTHAKCVTIDKGICSIDRCSYQLPTYITEWLQRYYEEDMYHQKPISFNISLYHMIKCYVDVTENEITQAKQHPMTNHPIVDAVKRICGYQNVKIVHDAYIVIEGIWYLLPQHVKFWLEDYTNGFPIKPIQFHIEKKRYVYKNE